MRGGEMATLVVDVGGNNVKLRCEGYDERRKAPSGPDYRPEQLLKDVQRLAADWNYTRISIGCPGPVANNRVVRDLVNLGPGWMEFDFTQAFGVPVRLVNDAVMQAIGSYEGGKMLFLGLGTGLGNTMIVDGTIIPMELGHLPYRKDHTYEDYVGNRGLEKRGRARWEAHVHKVVRLFQEALLIDDVVLGGGNARKLKELPKGCRIGDNENAFIGGFRLWDDQA
ncbi:MAG TPA: ROK family protein [Geminicoccus sp.]|uniref:ROK family protein n=1 Tax=Geminicoccus sp. TaxID=2024832 RepID=UPI002C3889D8|nr:ROK family protein [Geminicoccus sp.]HWL71925.1 ROK family protein [Geminicoccus sp.]